MINKTRALAVPITVYLGSGAEGIARYERLVQHVIAKGYRSVSELVVTLIDREVGKS